MTRSHICSTCHHNRIHDNTSQWSSIMLSMLVRVQVQMQMQVQVQVQVQV
jgi:hypothetical protein